MWQATRKSCLLLYRAGDNLVDNDGVELAGYLTFLALLALFPFLVLIVVYVFLGSWHTTLIPMLAVL